jgi:hypothetical protein
MSRRNSVRSSGAGAARRALWAPVSPAEASVWGVSLDVRSPAHITEPVLRQTPRAHRRSPAQRGTVPEWVPLPGSQCGAGNGRTIAWTAHDDECCLAIGH